MFSFECIVCDVLEFKPKVKTHSPVQIKILYVCDLAITTKIRDLAKILTTKWSRENYAIFMDSEPKYTIYVFYKRSLDC